MSQLSKLREAKTRSDLAVILGFKPSAMTSIIYKTPDTLKYTVFEIDKKSGGKREIKAPTPKLKKLQSHLGHVLYQCLTEIEKEQKGKAISFGFRKDRSIADNARKHKRHRYVLNIDLSDFFPTFNFGRVRGYFLKDKTFELEKDVATTIAQIACDGKALPQGSPCSPVISELIAQILDMRLVRFAKKHGVTYSRYADDITFSTNKKEFPKALAHQDSKDSSVWHLGKKLIDRIEDSGFQINDRKTRMHCRGSRQMVTGLVINEKVNIRSEYYRNARAMCDAVFQSGQYYKSIMPAEKDGEDDKPEWINNLNPLEGKLSFIYAIIQSEERREIKDQREKPRAIRKLYRRFLFYKHCMALTSPLIITEGKTDPVYLREAIKRRTGFHPTLGKPGKEGFEHSIRYLNYEGQAHEIMGLGGGTGDLKSIVLDYLYNLNPSKKRAKPFKHKPMKHPVILLLDSDDGLGDVAGTIKTNFGVSFSWNSKKDFYHVTENLYVVKTPELGGKMSCIEDLFPSKWRKKKLNGKAFHPANKGFDRDKHYSKEVFAKSVVQANADKIEFSGFDPLLKRISKVLEHYQAP